MCIAHFENMGVTEDAASRRPACSGGSELHCVRGSQGQAPTMKTGVPVSTLVKSDSASGILIRMHPCEAE